MTVPDELKRGAPRSVRLSRQGWKTAGGWCLKVVLLIAIAVWAGMQTGHRISHVSGHPSVTVIAPNPPGWWAWRAGAGIVFAAVVGWIGFRRQLRLLMYGRATVARVTGDVTPWWYRSRRPRGLRRLQCEFGLLSGGTCRTTVETRDKTLAVNREIVVLYDPDEPEKATLYPTRMLKVGGR